MLRSARQNLDTIFSIDWGHSTDPQLRKRRFPDETAIPRQAGESKPFGGECALQQLGIRMLARKGGKAPKGDALQELILAIVRKDPRISEKQLLDMLAGEAGADVVTSIDEPSNLLAGDTPCIHFDNDDGRPKIASVQGLKDRLSRAKRKIKNSR